MYDVLVSVDGVPVAGLSDQAIKRLVIGQVGTKVLRHMYIRTPRLSALARPLPSSLSSNQDVTGKPLFRRLTAPTGEQVTLGLQRTTETGGTTKLYVTLVREQLGLREQ
jgi:hypothetical protein